jgi:hypothetical protein
LESCRKREKNGFKPNFKLQDKMQAAMKLKSEQRVISRKAVADALRAEKHSRAAR